MVRMIILLAAEQKKTQERNGYNGPIQCLVYNRLYINLFSAFGENGANTLVEDLPRIGG